MNNQINPVVIVIVFSLYWCFICWLLSLISGWQRLYKTHPANVSPNGKKITVSGNVGLVSYSKCLFVHVVPEGIFLSVLFLFAVGHRPLFIPWTEIHNLKKKSFLWTKTAKFEVGATRIATMRLPMKVFDQAIEGTASITNGHI